MQRPSTPPLAVTMGEPGGVGGEITVKAWRALAAEGLAFFALDDPARLEALGARVRVIAEPAEAGSIFATHLPVFPLGAEIASRPGVAETANAVHVIQSIKRAVELTLEGTACGVVTNPLQKSTLLAGDFAFPGHTEYLGALTASAPMARQAMRRGPVMMLAGPALKTVPVTVHTPLVEAARHLTAAMITEKATVAADALRFDFGIDHPRLAVAGLNPHAGEGGALGHEDNEIVRPAVEALCAAGINAAGPLSADTMFHEEARARYDAAICMYHDQALIPVKTLAFHEAVNVTLGLPIVRTSPDHGTALDIAGKGTARPDSLIAAIRLADTIARRRAAAR